MTPGVIWTLPVIIKSNGRFNLVGKN